MLNLTLNVKTIHSNLFPQFYYVTNINIFWYSPGFHQYKIRLFFFQGSELIFYLLDASSYLLVGFFFFFHLLFCHLRYMLVFVLNFFFIFFFLAFISILYLNI